MCLGVPSKVIALNGPIATIECFGEQRDVSLLLLSEPVQLGDYLLTQAGGFASEVVPEARALESL